MKPPAASADELLLALQDMRRVAALPEPEREAEFRRTIVRHGLVEEKEGRWEMTAKGREFLAAMNSLQEVKRSVERTVRTVTRLARGPSRQHGS